jgi:hypothetical protein
MTRFDKGVQTEVDASPENRGGRAKVSIKEGNLLLMDKTSAHCEQAWYNLKCVA